MLRARNTRWGKRLQSFVAVILVMALMPAFSGCYGTFPLTKAVYEFNDEAMTTRLGDQILFWIFIILPVYGVATLGDAVIFNLVEFWTGDTLDVTNHTLEDGTEITLEPVGEQDAVLTVQHPAGAISTMRFHRDDNGVVTVFDAEGAPSGYVVPDADGNLRLENAFHGLVQSIGLPGAEENASMHAAIE